MACCIAAIALIAVPVPLQECVSLCEKSSTCVYYGYNDTSQLCYECPSITTSVSDIICGRPSKTPTTSQCDNNKGFCVICPDSPILETSTSQQPTLVIPSHVSEVLFSQSCSQPGITGNFENSSLRIKFRTSVDTVPLIIDGAFSFFHSLDIDIERSNIIIKNFDIGTGTIILYGTRQKVSLQNMVSTTQPLLQVVPTHPDTFVFLSDTLFTNLSSPGRTAIIAKVSGELSVVCFDPSSYVIQPVDGSSLTVSAQNPCNILNIAHDLGFISENTITREENSGRLFQSTTLSWLPIAFLASLGVFMFMIILIAYTKEGMLTHTISAARGRNLRKKLSMKTD